MSEEIEDKDCPRCGALLPDAEEGVCRTCGYEYGRATLFMPAVKVDQPMHTSEPASLPQDAAPPMMSSTMPQQGPPSPSAGGNQPLMLILAALGGLILLVLIGLGVFFFVSN